MHIGLDRLAARPALGPAAIAAALIAPAIFSDDERGYLQTSLITTPLIAAATMIGPHSWSTAKQEISRLKNIAKNDIPTLYNVGIAANKPIIPISQAQSMYDAGNLSVGRYNASLLDHISQTPEVTSSFAQLRAERGALIGKVDKTLGNASQRSLAINAFYSSRRNTASALELAQGALGTTLDANVSLAKLPNQVNPVRQTIAAEYRAHRHDLDWVRRMNARFDRIPRLIDAGAADVINAGSGALIESLDWGTQARNLLIGADRPELVGLIDSLISGNTIGHGDIKLKGLVSNNAFNQILGFTVRKDKQLLNISLVDKQTRRAMLGSGFDLPGVSRMFYTADELRMADVHAFKSLVTRSPKDIERELARAQFAQKGKDALDSRTKWYDAPSYVGEGMTAEQMHWYGNQAVPSELGGFRKGNDSVGFSTLDAEGQVKGITDASQTHNLVKLSGGDASVLEAAELAQMEPFNQPNTGKEGMHGKSFKQDWRAEVPAGMEPFYKTSYLEEKGMSDGMFGLNIAQLTPQEFALASDLPSHQELSDLIASRMRQVRQSMNKAELRSVRDVQSARRMVYGHAFKELGIEQRSLEALKNSGFSPDQAQAAWRALSERLMQKKNLNSFRRLGYMGEGGVAIAGDIAGTAATRHRKYIVDSLHIDRSVTGNPISSSQVLGMHLYDPVTAEGDVNFVENVHDLGDGRSVIDVTEKYGWDAAKFQGDTKWTNANITQDEVANAAEVLNAVHEAGGSAQRFDSNVAGFALQNYFSDKAVNPAESLMSQGAGLMRRVNKYAPELLYDDIFSDARSGLHDLGIDLNKGTLTEWTNAMSRTYENGARIEQAAAIVQNMFAQVSEQLHDAAHNGANSYSRLLEDPFLRGFANSDLSWEQYSKRGSYAANMTIADHMRTNVPSSVHINREVLEQLELNGDPTLLAAMQRQITTDGNAGLTREMFEHIDDHIAKGDWSQSFGRGTISLDEAVGDSTLELSTAMGRTKGGGQAMTTFDPGHAMAADNFGMKMPNGDILPILGHDAYGGKVNRHDLGEFSANSWEGPLRDVVDSARGLNELPYEEAKSKYLGSLRQLGEGKNSFLNVPREVSNAFGGRLTGAPSALRYADGTVNPYEFRVGNSHMRHFSEEVQGMLKNGEDVWGALGRYPVNSIAYGRIKYDPSIGAGRIGTTLETAKHIGGDNDGDYSFLIAHDQKLKGGGLTPEAAHIKALAMDPKSSQAQMGDLWRSLQRIEDVPRKDFLEPFKGDSLFSQVKKQAMATPEEALGALRRRTSGQSVGELSNTLELLRLNLLHNEQITNTGQRQALAAHFYDIARETPIAAMKLKGDKSATYDLAKVRAMSQRLRDSLRTGGANGEHNFLESVRQLSRVYGKEEVYNAQDHAGALSLIEYDERGNFKGRIQTDKVNPLMRENGRYKVNVHEALVDQNLELFRKVHSGHTAQADRLLEQLTMMPEKAAASKRAVTEGLENAVASLQASSRVPAGASTATAALGEINEGIKQSAVRRARGVQNAAEHAYEQGMKSAGRVAESMKGHGAGKALAMGAAVAAGAGLLLGSMHSPREGQALTPSHDSMNAHRPEERIGTEDSIPGEPVSGSMASRPPRTIRQASPGVQTAVVAPMHNQANLEVRMRSHDRDRAAEVARTTSRLSSGDGNSNTTVNYRNVRSGALRTADKIRDLLS